MNKHIRFCLTAWLCLCLLCGSLLAAAEDAVPARVSPTEHTFVEGETSLDTLRAFFTHGDYWNHLSSGEDDPYSVTDTACSPYLDDEGLHEDIGVVCNYFEISGKVWGGWQCCGYARLLTYWHYGSSFENWERAETLADVKAGDVLYLYNGGPHYIWILSLADNGDGTATVTYADCNGAGRKNRCQIQWDVVATLNTETDTVDFPLLGSWALERLYIAPTPLGGATDPTTPTEPTVLPTVGVQYHLSGGTVGEPALSVNEQGLLCAAETGLPCTATVHAKTPVADYLPDPSAWSLSREGYTFVGWGTSRTQADAAALALATAPFKTREKALADTRRRLAQTTWQTLCERAQAGESTRTVYAIWVPAV